MPKNFFRPPLDLVKEWPEIFEDLYINTLPVAYLDYIRLEFTNGRVWEIDIKNKIKETKAQVIADKLLETFYEYRTEIKKVDFKVDVERLRKDITAKSKSLLE